MSSIPPLTSIADPLRLRLLRWLAEHDSGSLDELAGAAGVHPNTLRPHLHDLESSGIVLRDTAVRDAATTRSRGRPRVLYRLAPGWHLPGVDFLGLAELLSVLVMRADPSADEISWVGREWGRYLAGRPGQHDIGRGIPAALERLGFHARMTTDGRVLLSGCPCALVMPDRPALLCHLAVAVVEGMIEAAGSDLRVGAAAHDPPRRRCALDLVTSGREP